MVASRILLDPAFNLRRCLTPGLVRAPAEAQLLRRAGGERRGGWKAGFLRRVYETVSAREPAFELFTRDSEADFRDASPDQGVAAGPEAGWTELLKYIDMFDGFRVELYDVIHADKDKVVTEARDGGRVKGSGAQVRNHYFHVFKFRGDKIARWSTHRSRNRALEAAGISQDPR